MGEAEIPFQPSEVDIVSTKIRTWNNKHEGNKFYTNLIAETVAAGGLESPSDVRRAAEKMFRILTVERGGRFLKLPEGLSTSETCTIMTDRRCVEKIIHGLKTAMAKKDKIQAGILQPYAKQHHSGKKRKKIGTPLSTLKRPKEEASTSPASNAAAQVEVQAKSFVKDESPKAKTPSTTLTLSVLKGSGRPTPSPRVKSATPTKNKKKKIMYKAVEGTQPMHKYSLDLVSLVCSQINPITAHRVLDKPGSPYTLENEPDKERAMRLQIRQRFASAAAVGMTSIEFGRKLMKMWGGRLVAETVQPEQSPQKDIATPIKAATPATDDDTKDDTKDHIIVADGKNQEIHSSSAANVIEMTEGFVTANEPQTLRNSHFQERIEEAEHFETAAKPAEAMSELSVPSGTDSPVLSYRTVTL